MGATRRCWDRDIRAYAGGVAAVTLHRISTKAMLAALTPAVRLPHRRAETPVTARVLGTLRLKVGQLCPVNQLVDSVYGDDPTGGPVRAGTNISLAVVQLRRLGWPIEAQWGRGYSLLRSE
jgi:hypothetical protein